MDNILNFDEVKEQLIKENEQKITAKQIIQNCLKAMFVTNFEKFIFFEQ